MARKNIAKSSFPRQRVVTGESCKSRQIRAERLEARGRLSAAIREYFAWAELDKNSHLPRLALCRVYLRLRRYSEGLHEGRKAIRLNPNVAESHYDVGRCLNSLGRCVEALKSFQKAQVLAKRTDSRPWTSAGIALCRMDRFIEAASCFKRAIRLKPYCTIADNYLMLGEALFKAGQLGRARKAFMKTLDLYEGWPSYEVPMRKACRMLGRIERSNPSKWKQPSLRLPSRLRRQELMKICAEARCKCHKTWRLEPSEAAEQHEVRGWRFFANRRYTAAEKEFRAALRYARHTEGSHERLGELLLEKRKGMTEQALEQAGILIKHPRSSRFGYLLAGRCLDGLGDLVGAETFLRKACELYSKSDYCWTYLGCTLGKLGEYSKAEAAFKNARAARLSNRKDEK